MSVHSVSKNYQAPLEHSQNNKLQNAVRSAKVNTIDTLSSMLGIALIIIGALAVTGHLTGVVAGGCAVGLTIPLLIMSILKTQSSPSDTKSRLLAVLPIILQVALIIIGSLGIAGAVLPATVGWVIIAPALLNLALVACGCCCGILAVGAKGITNPSLEIVH